MKFRRLFPATKQPPSIDEKEKINKISIQIEYFGGFLPKA